MRLREATFSKKGSGEEQDQEKGAKASPKCRRQTSEKHAAETKKGRVFCLDKIHSCLNDAFEVFLNNQRWH